MDCLRPLHGWLALLLWAPGCFAAELPSLRLQGPSAAVALLEPHLALARALRDSPPPDAGQLAALVQAAERQLGVTGLPLGMGIPGSLSPLTGRVRNANSTALNGQPLQQDLENLLNEAALLAGRRDEKAITMADLQQSVIKVIAGPEKHSRVIPEHERRLTAYHEAGHAIVGLYVPAGVPVHKATIIPRGRAGGYTMMLPEEDRSYETKSYYLAQIRVALGGRAQWRRSSCGRPGRRHLPPAGAGRWWRGNRPGRGLFVQRGRLLDHRRGHRAHADHGGGRREAALHPAPDRNPAR